MARPHKTPSSTTPAAPPNATTTRSLPPTVPCWRPVIWVNGLPATIIVTTTLRELEAGAGKALTGGRTLLPMGDVIRLASNAHHYLCIFDKGQTIALYHTKRWRHPVNE